MTMVPEFEAVYENIEEYKVCSEKKSLQVCVII